MIRTLTVLFCTWWLMACTALPAATTDANQPTPAPATTIPATLQPTADAPQPTPDVPSPREPVMYRVWHELGVTLRPSDVGVASGMPVADQSAVLLPDGRIRLYFFGQNQGILSAISDDHGQTFVPEPGQRLPDGNGMPRALTLPDGRIRLYVISGGGIASAISDDGLAFVMEPGLRLSNADAPVPELSGISVVNTDTGYRAYFSDLPRPGEGPKPHIIYSASSDDGLTWSFDEGVRMGASSLDAPDAMQQSAEHPFVLREADGSYTMYFARNQMLWSATSMDGLQWDNPHSLGIVGNDPDVLDSADGHRTIFYGDFHPDIGGFLLVAKNAESSWDVAVAPQPGGPNQYVIQFTGISANTIHLTVADAALAARITFDTDNVIAPATVIATVQMGPGMPKITVSDGLVTRSIVLMPSTPPA